MLLVSVLILSKIVLCFQSFNTELKHYLLGIKEGFRPVTNLAPASPQCILREKCRGAGQIHDDVKNWLNKSVRVSVILI